MTPQVYSGFVPEDVGGSPFPDGWEPDDDHDRGGADEEFASVVFDEDFVRAAEIHEPTAVERLLAAAEARAETEQHRGRARRKGPDDDLDDFYDAYEGPGTHPAGHDRSPDGYGESGHEPGPYDLYDPRAAEELGGRRGQGRWHRPVAWMLALLMGIGMVALAFTAVYRGASSGRQDQVPPPATTGVDTGPSASADYSAPPVSVQPRTP
ncbi:hypothetical protein ACFQVC_15225 [Streptomyces monticola]|uniref:Uncharacterized protein n=1 Tax=Streptomyces monticola TaxID=2666263 RepID=A0ABW2JJ83_9ACTN